MNNEFNLENERNCRGFSQGYGQKVMFFLIGGSIGAAIALLFAPKPGVELRRDITDATARAYAESLKAADEVRIKAIDQYRNVKTAGGDIASVVGEGFENVKKEFITDAGRIAAIVEASAAPKTSDQRAI